MNIRLATPADAPQIVQIFYDTIHKVNARDYTPEQIEAWASSKPNPSVWARDRMCTRTTYVADAQGAVLGFAELDRRGGIDCFYCHHAHQRQGIRSLFLHEIERTAISQGMTRLFTAASITAPPFFKAHGFVTVKQQSVIRDNIALLNFIMEKKLLFGTSPGSQKTRES